MHLILDGADITLGTQTNELVEAKNRLIRLTAKEDLELKQLIDSLESSIAETKAQISSTTEKLNLANIRLIEITNELHSQEQEIIKAYLDEDRSAKGYAEDTVKRIVSIQLNLIRAKREKAELEQKIKSLVLQQETSDKNTEELSAEIEALRAEVISLDAEIKSRVAELEVANRLRKNAFVSRAVRAYLRNMKKSDTHGGRIELEAMANIFERNIVLIQVGSDSGENVYEQIYATPSVNSTERSPLYIAKSTPHGSNEHATYQPMLPPGTTSAPTSAQAANMQVLPDSNSLFAACFRAAQIANGQALPKTNSSLYVAAYTLRLKVCDFLSENDAYLRERFSAVADATYQENNQGLNALAPELPSQELPGADAPKQEVVTIGEEEKEEFSTASPLPTKTPQAEQSADSSVSSAGFKTLYDNISMMLLDVCNMERFIGNICKIITQHYPEKFDKEIQDEASRKESIASYKSLEDAGNYELLWESNFDISLKEHEKAVQNFLHGRKDIVEKKSEDEGGQNPDHPNYSVARRYVDYVERMDEHFGGPIEIQALADIYNWKINLRVFTEYASGEPKYLKDFVPSTPKGNLRLVSLVLVRAGTDKAAFYIEGKGEPESASTATLYKACDAEGSGGAGVKQKVVDNLRAKIQPDLLRLQ